jgi:hypothetical protein
MCNVRSQHTKDTPDGITATPNNRRPLGLRCVCHAMGPRNPLRWSWISGTTVAIKSEIVYHRHFPMEIDCTATLQKISLSRVTAALEIGPHGR